MDTKTATANTINDAQAGELVKDMYNHVSGEFLPTAWNLFNKHFGVTSYRELPAERFEEAGEYIKGLCAQPETCETKTKEPGGNEGKTRLSLATEEFCQRMWNAGLSDEELSRMSAKDFRDFLEKEGMEIADKSTSRVVSKHYFEKLEAKARLAEKYEDDSGRRAAAENEDIEHGREVCHGFIAYQALRAIQCMFPEERYSTMHDLCIPQEGLHCLFHLLTATLRNDIEGHFGRY